ncbi:hypothetical protein D3C81_1669870 [compost metagenome]
MPALIASSSILASMAKMLMCAPSERMAEVRKGIWVTKVMLMRVEFNSYSGTALRSPSPSGWAIGTEGAEAKGRASKRAGNRRPALTMRSLCGVVQSS